MTLRIHKAILSCADDVYHVRQDGELVATILPSHQNEFPIMVVNNNNILLGQFKTITAAKRTVRAAFGGNNAKRKDEAGLGA